MFGVFLKTFVMLLVAVIREMPNSWWFFMFCTTFVFSPDYTEAAIDGKNHIFLFFIIAFLAYMLAFNWIGFPRTFNHFESPKKKEKE